MTGAIPLMGTDWNEAVNGFRPKRLGTLYLSSRGLVITHKSFGALGSDASRRVKPHRKVACL